MPWGLRRLLGFITEEYGKLDLNIGLEGAFKGDFNDVEKVAYLEAHLNQLSRAISESDLSVRVSKYFNSKF